MSDHKQILTEEQMDFLREVMNIGAGNAGTALQQMLQKPVDLKIPRVHTTAVTQISSIFDSPSLPVVCVRMGMVGDVNGDIFFIIPEESKERLVYLIKKATPGNWQLNPPPPDDMGLSALVEIANIVTGVCLNAIHDFCRLNIYHTVPVLAADMVQALLDEILIEMSYKVETVVAITNEFLIEEYQAHTYLLVIPSVESTVALVNSIEQARKAYVSK